MEKTMHVFRSDRLRKSVGIDDLTSAQFENGFYRTEDEKIAKVLRKYAANPRNEIVYVNELKNVSEANMILANNRNSTVSGLRSTDNS